jgi:predicted AAA+ superfamily ATPase
MEELGPLDALEVQKGQLNALWTRGGFPDSFLAKSDAESFTWRSNFLRTYLERDIPQFGSRVPAEVLRRFWTMLAHSQSQTVNASQLGASLGVSSVSVSRYLDLMVDLLLVRRLEPWVVNQKKRLVKAPKISIRDSGLCHALLGIRELEDLLGHPVAGASWESFAIENIIRFLPAHVRFGFYRTSAGAEIDLVVQLGSERLWAIEIKRSLAPVASKGFYSACEDLKPEKKVLVFPGDDTFPSANGVMVMSLSRVIEDLRV